MDIVSAGIVPVYSNQGVIEYLLLQHAGSSAHWDFPKGKVEKGENYREAALRELQEEAGSEASIIPGFEYSFSYFFKEYLSEIAPHQVESHVLHKTVFFYIGIVTNPHVTLSHEHQQYAWLPYEQAYKKLTYDTAKKLLEEVHLFLLKST